MAHGMQTWRADTKTQFYSDGRQTRLHSSYTISLKGKYLVDHGSGGVSTFTQSITGLVNDGSWFLLVIDDGTGFYLPTAEIFTGYFIIGNGNYTNPASIMRFNGTITLMKI